MSKKILFVTSANLTSNPRLLKELRYAVELNHEVSFIGFRLGNWSDNVDNKIVKELDARFTYLSAMRKPFSKWLLSTLCEKLCKIIFPFFKNNLKIAGLADKRSFLLFNYLNKHNEQYDIIVSHTLKSLYPAYKFANRTNTQFTFDIEDYHVGETCTEREKKIRTLLMQRLIPKAIWVSYASPLIGKYSLELCNNNIKNHTLINNCFSAKEFIFKENHSEKVKFAWFSQNIASGRGLEQILPIIEQFKNKVEVHLIGNLYQNFYDNVLARYSDFITIHKPVSQEKLNLKLSEFDIGLAIERAKDLNNDIAAFNKIWAYMQAGLYILATDIRGQSLFMKEHSNCGLISKQSNKNLSDAISKIISEIGEIRNTKKQRYEYAQQHSWEQEREKLFIF